MARDIVIWPHKVLTSATRPVTDFGPALEKLLEEMAEAMREAKGIGIAANQVGEPLRVALVGREDGTSFEIVNPRLLERSGPITLEEGCLSVPGLSFEIVRPDNIHLTGVDLDGNPVDIQTGEYLGRVFQHELDHLDGVLMLERTDDESRREALATLRRTI